MTFPSGARLGSYEWNGGRWVWTPTLKDFQVGTAYLPGPAEEPNPALFRPAPTRVAPCSAADAWWEEEIRLVRRQHRLLGLRRALYAIVAEGRGVYTADMIIDLLTKRGML